MSENIKGHLIHYKNEKGEWIPLPVSIISVYDAYVAYCNENNIKPADETTYYQTVGNLQTLVKQLSGSTEAIEDFAAALDGGVLPVSKGGTGYDNMTTFAIELRDLLIGMPGANQLATDVFVNEQINEAFNSNDIYITDMDSKLNRSEIASGNLTPNDNPNLSPACVYYFQV